MLSGSGISTLGLMALERDMSTSLVLHLEYGHFCEHIKPCHIKHTTAQRRRCISESAEKTTKNSVIITV